MLQKLLLIVVEIVDKPERIAAFLPELDQMIQEGLITLERAQVIAYRNSLSRRDICSLRHYLQNKEGGVLRVLRFTAADLLAVE